MQTPSQIKQFLEANSMATVDQLSQSLDLTKADIHYHVRKMFRQGLIITAPQLYQSGAGRPARQYQLVRSIPVNLSRSVVAVLIARINNKNQKTPLHEEIARGILNQCSNVSETAASPTVRLNRLLMDLVSFGILLRWRAGKNGPVIHLEDESLSGLIEDKDLSSRIIQSIIDQLIKKVT